MHDFMNFFGFPNNIDISWFFEGFSDEFRENTHCSKP